MMKERGPDLFDVYPDGPGYKENETSREAAEAIAPLAGRLRTLAFKYICDHPGHTADEIADALGESLLTIRPRISELRTMGWITNEGHGFNKSGRRAHQWWRTVE